MNVLIIYCHPSSKSYTFDILQQVISCLSKESINYEISDLYKMNFQSDMTEEEYEREGFVKKHLPIPNDVLTEHEKIKNADAIIFLYPVWWSDCPAKLKGWFDRVYTVGYAYSNKTSSSIEKMKTVKYGLAICTAGHPLNYLKQIGIAESMRNIMIDDRLGMRFQNKEMIILGGTLDKEKVKSKHSNIINNLGAKIIENCK